MAIQLTPENSYIKELAKWEHRDTEVHGTIVRAVPVAEGGKKGALFEEFPKMLYRAESADGGPRIDATKVVRSEAEESIACGQGWSVTQEQAIARVHEAHRERAKLAAERAATERWMSPKAQAEAAAVDEATIEHVPSIPETPIKPKRKD